MTIRPFVDLSFRAQEPLIDFRRFHLRHDVADDELLASAIEFAEEGKLGPEAVLVATADLGLELKGRSQASIRICLLPDSLRLPDELDSEEKRMKELEVSLEQMTNRLPKLSLTMNDGKDFQELILSKQPLCTDEAEIAEAMRRLRAKHPYLAPTPCPPPGWTFSRGDETDLQEYNRELYDYFSRYERFLRSSVEAENWQNRTRPVWLRIHNGGCVPAEDIDVSLRFPECIAVVPESDLKACPERPLPPQHPGQPKQRESQAGCHGRANLADAALIRQNARTTEISKAGGWNVRFHVERLKHTFAETLPAINLHFPSEDTLRSLQFTYKIVAANFPRPVEGALNLKVTLSQ